MPDTLAPPPAAPPIEHPLTWEEVCAHPALRDLPFRIELDRYGRLLMSPLRFRHGRQQVALVRLLVEQLGGEVSVECAIETSEGVRVPDVVWMSEAFLASADPDAFALPVAPEICVEVRSPSNPWAEMHEKVQLYLARGAQEVWVCDPDGAMHYFGHEGARERSRLAPDFPARVELARPAP